MSNHATIAIAIITYKRPSSLAHTLGSLQSLVLPENTEIKLIVVDNDANKTALSLVDDFRAELPFAVEYMVEEKRGIPYARNAALAAASKCDYLAFIDDDDVAEPGWLAALYAAAKRFEADVVKGQMHHSFPEGKEYLGRLDIFAPLPAATGSELDSAWTNNVLFATHIYKENGLRFDARFARTGGSDHHFFSRAKMQGAKIIMCQEAIVKSPVPEKRCRWRYLAMRHMRVGATMTIVDCKQRGYPGGVCKVIGACGDSSAYAYRLARGVAKGYVPTIHPVMVMLFLVGRVMGLLHLVPREYK